MSISIEFNNNTLMNRGEMKRMKFSTIISVIFKQFNYEKTVNAAYYLLRGKRSGQAIQDAKYYQLENYFSILPKLSLQQFNEEIAHLVKIEYIKVDESSFVMLTNEGLRELENMPENYFNGWHYRGREQIFFKRLNLIVQTVSQFKNGEPKFIPLENDTEIQRFVKQFLQDKAFQTPAFAQMLYFQLQTVLEHAPLTDVQKNIFVYRLTGYEQIGWTWSQLASTFNMRELDAKLLWVECLHYILREAEQNPKLDLLREMAFGIRLVETLTESTQKTQKLFQEGYPLEQIAQIRNLKNSTIEDHYIEMALNDPYFPIAQFVTVEQMRDVQQQSSQLQTKKLSMLKEQFPKLSYFQLRLILAVPMKE